MKMKKSRRETLQLIILMLISIPLIGISIIYGTSVDWVLYWGWVIFIFYQISPIVFAAYRTKKELIDFEEDRMTVYPRSYGHRLVLGILYRLKWIRGQVGWEGYGILTGKPMCWLRVTGVKDA